LRIKNRNLQK
jgi:hypothetical protein